MITERFPLDRIDPNPHQVRLAEAPEHIAKVALSIAHSGLLQNPVGRKNGGRIELAFGHTRLAAFERIRREDVEAGGDGGEWVTMPVDVRELTDLEMFELAIRENVDRKDLTPIEEARAMVTYRDVFGKTSAQIGELFGLSDSAVRNRMRLLDLPAPVQQRVEVGEITEGTARKLLTVQKLAPKRIEDLASDLVKGGFQHSGAIDDQLSDVMEEEAHQLCYESGGRTPTAGDGLWRLDWKGKVETPTVGAASKVLATRERKVDPDVLQQVIAAFASGTDVAGAVELYGIVETAAAWIRQLVAPPPCTACEFHQVLNGVHYCGVKACWEQKKAGWIASETRRVAKKLGIPVYEPAKDGRAKVSAPQFYAHRDGELEASWQKLLDGKDGSLRVRGVSPKWTKLAGTASEVVELIRVGKPAEKAKAEQKRRPSGSYDYEAQRRNWAQEQRREEASLAFIQAVAAPLFAVALAPHENPEALQLVLDTVEQRRIFTRRGGKLPEKRKERLAALREALATEVLREACARARLIRGPGATAKHLAGVAKTLGVRLPRNWDEAAAAYDAGVSTETEDEG